MKKETSTHLDLQPTKTITYLSLMINIENLVKILMSELMLTLKIEIDSLLKESRETSTLSDHSLTQTTTCLLLMMVQMLMEKILMLELMLIRKREISGSLKVSTTIY